MGKLLMVYNQGDKEKYKTLFELVVNIWKSEYSRVKGTKENLQIEEIMIKNGIITNAVIRQLRASDVKYIFSFNMAGFEAKALLEDPLYNIVTAKQLHMITDRPLLEQYKNQDMALNLFFYVTGEREELQHTYQHVLNLEGLPETKWNNPQEVEDNRVVLEQMITSIINQK